MIKVVGVRFKEAGKIYYFDPDKINIRKNNYAIVETARGVEFGHVVTGPKMIGEDEIVSPLKKVLRVANDEDILAHEKNLEKAKEAMEICQEKVEEHSLGMRVIDVEYTFDNNKIIFYFTADGRVDFRDLVKDLAAIFRTRIELRQIGVRDEAKMVGGLGPCGRACCCSSFLGEFEPVSIKMAKEQNLSLNPAKISGLCGRLMCCLKYEQEAYEDILRRMPEVGRIAITPLGRGPIVETYTLLERVKVRVKLEDDTEDLVQYHISEIKMTKRKDSRYIRQEKEQEFQENDISLKDLEE